MKPISNILILGCITASASAAELILAGKGFAAHAHAREIFQMPGNGHNLGVWCITNEPEIRHWASYHNTRCFSPDGRYLCCARDPESKQRAEVNRKDGLNIIFFNTRGLRGESIFNPALAPRTGDFKQYHSGDLNGYHISCWAGERGTAHVRKNKGFALAATGKDLVLNAPAAAFDDDGQTHGPVWTHPGWIGLRQMVHTIRCEYDDLKRFPYTT
jgi:hypothetical protein